MSTEVNNASYIANVLLPVSILNLNETSLTKLNSFKSCPVCNVAASSSSSSTTSASTSGSVNTSLPANNPNLTPFGNFFLNLIVNEFNTLYGTDYKSSDFTINTISQNDQNSLCAYLIINQANNFSITTYIELSNQVHISMRFDEADYGVY